MEILRIDKTKKTNIQLIKDYRPNPAMVNEFQTMFFTLKLNHMEIVDHELNDFVIDDIAQYLILDVSIHNITNEILSMFKYDFLLSFDSEEPYEPEEYFEAFNQLENEYALKPDEIKRGRIIYIIGKSAKKIMFRFTEYFDDDSEGKTYRLKYEIK
ncbi:MAG: hypothetical protein RR802_09540 [Erysipelotrichaceae bacterium]